MKKDLYRYCRIRCEGVLPYSIFLDYVRDLDARYPKYDEMSFRTTFVKVLRSSSHRAAEEMGWDKPFTLDLF